MYTINKINSMLLVLISLLFCICEDLTNGRDGRDGSNGKSIIWLGEYDTVPTNNIDTLNAYYNKTLKVSLIWTGSQWDTLSVNGINGLHGSNGNEIIWLGKLDTVPTNSIDTLNAYYNKVFKVSFIWTGSQWDTLSVSGANGLQGSNGKAVVWLGEHDTVPTNSIDTLNSYYNKTLKVSFIWTGSQWDTLSVSGTNGLQGSNGKAVVWLGEHDTVPTNSIDTLNAYYNKVFKVSFIWTGSQWDTLSVSGTNQNVLIMHEDNIQQVIDSVGLAGGGTITLGSDTFLLNNHIHIGYNNITIAGQGESTLLKIDSAQGYLPL